MSPTLSKPSLSDTSLADLQRRHIRDLQKAYEDVMASFGVEAVAIYSGHAVPHFGDDQYPSFQTYAHFMHWAPLPEAQHSWLLIRKDARPALYLYAPEDYWHLPAQLPEEAWVDEFDVQRCSEPTPPLLGKHTAIIGDVDALAATGSLAGDIQPEALLRALDELRLYKSDYEVACLREANRYAIAGHQAALSAFQAAGSELDIQLAYLAASRQRESLMPYQNIVGLNQHAGVLHYQHYEVNAPQHHSSLLVDAGHRYRGYCADLTRTHAGPDAPSLFAELIQAVTAIKDNIIDAIAPGVSFLELHEQMHHHLADALITHDLFHGSAEQAIESGVTRAFCPHGLGHSLGLQVHDVAGKRHPDGSPSPAPALHPALRLTRTLRPDMVVTIEPGCYFIPMLLNPLRTQPLPINWTLVDRLSVCGGIRVEDNVLVTVDKYQNLTQDFN